MNAQSRIVLQCVANEGAADWSCVGGLEGVSLMMASGGAEGLQQLRAAVVDAVLVRFPLDGWVQDAFLEAVQRASPATHFLAWNPLLSTCDAVRLMKLGAFHCFGEPMERVELERQLEAIGWAREAIRGTEAADAEWWRRFLIGKSRAMETVCNIVRLVGPRRATVLIQGETGTGKEMVARALHGASDRRNLPMVAINCSALPEHLLEAELFGHVKGAFTGAVALRVGRFEQANHSTIFFDEIGDMPIELQAKLLRVLQEREFQRLGSSETMKVDVRVVAATNVHLLERVEDGRFREDLYYRLNVVPLRIPPLRERREDIPLLVWHFVEKVCQLEGIPEKSVSAETLRRLAEYTWPGNVRQLENAMETAIAMSGGRDTLYPSDFPLPAAPATAAMTATITETPTMAVPDGGLDFEEVVNRFERSILKQALAKTAGNKKQAADMLRMKRTTLAAKLRSLEASV